MPIKSVDFIVKAERGFFSSLGILGTTFITQDPSEALGFDDLEHLNRVLATDPRFSKEPWKIFMRETTTTITEVE